MNNLLITIQSANRFSQVAPMTEALEELPALWCVPASQADSYRSAGANVLPVAGELPMKPKQLNAALDLGFAEGKVVVTMDDDFVEADYVKATGQNQRYPLTLPELIKWLVQDLTQSNFRLAGIAGTTNPFFANTEPANFGMVTGQVLAHARSPLRFDENLPILEDLDYIIAHHVYHKGIVKNRAILPNFHIFGRSAKSDAAYEGGYKNYRTEEVQEQTLAILTAKWAEFGLVFENNGLGQSVQKKVAWRKLVA